MSETAWVEVGAEVMEVSSSTWGVSYGRTLKIAKVHKNGNFVVEGSPQQWRPWDDRAHRTGASRYGRETLRLVTPELMAEAAEACRLAKARKAVRAEIERLEKALRSDSEVLAAFAALSPSPASEPTS